MTDARRYPHFRTDLVLYLLDNEATPAQVAEWLAKDGRARLEEIGNLRVSTNWAEANRRIIGKRHANDRQPNDRLWTPDGYVRRDGQTSKITPEPQGCPTIAEWEQVGLPTHGDS